MSLFGKSAVEKHIDALTDESRRDSDIQGNLELADSINQSTGDGKAELKYLMKRIQHKNPHVQMLALSLLDLIVKNCFTATHQLLGTKDNLKIMSEMGTDPKLNPAVRDMVLTLMETWSETFNRPNEFQIPIFGEYYLRLKRKGVEFPARDMTAMAPVATPQRRESAVASPYANPYGNNPYPPPNNPSVSPPGGGYVPPAYHVPQQPVYNNHYPGSQQQIPPPYYAPPQPQQQMQQPPPQQQQQPVQQYQPSPDASRAARKRAKMSERQVALYRQCTYLSAEFIHKCKKETNLAFDYLNLLKDLSSASDSPRALKSDPLASNLQRVLVEIRTRYTTLILELGDMLAVGSATAAEFIIDLAIKMIDNIRIVIDYHQLKLDGVECSPPDIVLPRSLTAPESNSKRLAAGRGPSSSSSSVKSPVSQKRPAAAAVAAQSSSRPEPPKQMQLFDMPAPPADEEDEKQIAASVFAQARPPRASLSSPSPAAPAPAPSFSSLPSPAPAPAPPSYESVSSSASPPAAHASSASPTRFESSPHFTPHESFQRVNDAILDPQPGSGEPDRYHRPSVDAHYTLVSPTKINAGEGEQAKAQPGGPVDNAASAFEFLAPTRSDGALPASTPIAMAPGGPHAAAGGNNHNQHGSSSVGMLLFS